MDSKNVIYQNSRKVNVRYPVDISWWTWKGGPETIENKDDKKKDYCSSQKKEK